MKQFIEDALAVICMLGICYMFLMAAYALDPLAK